MLEKVRFLKDFHGVKKGAVKCVVPKVAEKLRGDGIVEDFKVKEVKDYKKKVVKSCKTK